VQVLVAWQKMMPLAWVRVWLAVVLLAAEVLLGA
jgi:hypothetical protein